MRGLTSTIALLVVLLGLGGYIYFVDAGQPAAGADTKDKAFSVDADALEELTVTTDGQTSVLQKADGTWKMVKPVESAADDTEVSSLTSNLATLDVNRVVDEQATDLAQYGLDTPAVEVAFKAADDVEGSLALGDKTPTGGDIYAMHPGDPQVFLVSAFLESTFKKTPFDLRDKRILHFERDKVDRLEIDAGPTDIVLTRDGNTWMVEKPIRARGDYGVIEGLITRLSSAPMSKLVATAPKSLTEYGLTKPELVLSIGTGSSTAALAVAAAKDGEVHAQDRTRNLVFTIDPTLATDLHKGVDDYRDKDLFDFRPFNADRLRIVRGDDTYEFEKVGMVGENPEHWTRTGATPAEVEGAKMDELLNKLTSLQAQSFSGSTDSNGLQQPALVVAVSFDGGKFERVRIGRSGGEAFAARDPEPGAARLDPAAVDAAVKALDAVVAPPTATPATTPADDKS